MIYNIFDRTAPAMPKPGKGTEIVKLLLTQASKDMYEPLVPMFFPIFGAHMSGAEFQYPDFSWKELTGLMANLVAKSGDNKGQLTTLKKIRFWNGRSRMNLKAKSSKAHVNIWL